MSALCFIDTETTSLRRDRRAWEIGIIERVPIVVKHPDGPDTYETEDREHHWFVDANDLNMSRADLMAFKIGRFYDRHPQAVKGGDLRKRTLEMPVQAEHDVLWQVEAVTRGAHLVGAVVSFDAEVLAARMAAHDICPSWHYHLIDVEALTVGYLNGRNAADFSYLPAELPWKSDDLSARLGVEVSDEDRHTALGDARWARDLYDAVMGGAS